MCRMLKWETPGTIDHRKHAVQGLLDRGGSCVGYRVCFGTLSLAWLEVSTTDEIDVVLEGCFQVPMFELRVFEQAGAFRQVDE